jgi:CheY-like chemotaxis protein
MNASRPHRYRDGRAQPEKRSIVVLIADDDDESRAACAAYLEGKGMRVIHAADGGEAVVEARRARPDVILLDIEMPVLDGGAALRRLKADPRTRAIPVVMLTGQSTGSSYRALTDAGCAAYLIKPCLPEDLEGVLTSLSDARRLEAR